MFSMNRVTNDFAAHREDEPGGPDLRCVTPHGTNLRGAVAAREPAMNALQSETPTEPATERSETVGVEAEGV